MSDVLVPLFFVGAPASTYESATGVNVAACAPGGAGSPPATAKATGRSSNRNGECRGVSPVGRTRPTVNLSMLDNNEPSRRIFSRLLRGRTRQ